jgi:hypothetical protein
MPRSTQTVDDKLAELSELDTVHDPERVLEQIREALGHRHCRVVARAANISAERLLYDLEPGLLKAYQAFLRDPVKQDPSCVAKGTIARALVDLECQDAEFFVAGVHYEQMEPVWGGTVDTAVDLRCSCAMGLVATGYPRALHELTPLLCDPVANARRGAIRAVACANPRDAELVLRLKVLSGDSEPEVIGDCFTGLLSAAPEESLEFVAGFLDSNDANLQELAALSLGESRVPEALDCLQSTWGEPVLIRPFHRILLRAVALHRSDVALGWLVSMIEQSSPATAAEALSALSVYTHNSALSERIKASINARGDAKLAARFAELWSTE